MRNARFKRQADGSVLVQLKVEGGPCNLCTIYPDLSVEFFVNCPPVSVYALIAVLVHACEVLLTGKAFRK
jgi:hypothetical protein